MFKVLLHRAWPIGSKNTNIRSALLPREISNDIHLHKKSHGNLSERREILILRVMLKMNRMIYEARILIVLFESGQHIFTCEQYVITCESHMSKCEPHVKHV